MSLVITSNVGQENNPQMSNAFKPYSYQNRLLNTMKIPPNSEIALQSAKINKNGLFVLTRGNSGFCHYFGTPIEDLHNDNIENSTTVPFRAVIGSGEAFRAGDERNEVNIADMVGQIQKGMNEAVFHPSLINSATTSNLAVTAAYDSSSEVFEGFKFAAVQQTAKTSRAAKDIVFTPLNKNDDGVTYGSGQVDGVITSTTEGGFYAQNREYPISQQSGECIFDIKNCNVADSEWMVGLSRINQPRDTAVGDFAYRPDYFAPPAAANLREGVFVNGQLWYSDISVVRHGTELRVYQAGSRTAIAGGSANYVNEVTYYGAHNANFNAQYDIGTNGSNYEKVKFVLKNEELQIFLIDDKAAEVLLCDYTTLRAAGAIKNECLNPVNAAKWAMYPVCALASIGGTAAVGKSITLDSVEHYTAYPKYDETKYFNYDWWGWSQQYNQTVFCRELELRDWNNFSRTTTNHGVAAIGLLAPKGISGTSNVLTDYSSIIITARSDGYGRVNTELCNTQSTLGFVGDPVSRPNDSTPLISTNTSSSIPKLISNISLFIRLNNFTQTSVNARKGTTSKIVAHLPRFDNSGNETGGLYFEPHEKTYLSLGNTEEILINSFDVDFVYENETLCTALTAKSVVVFHIRQKR